MKLRLVTWTCLVLAACATASPAARAKSPAKAPPLPENLARRATITANSEYSGQYLAKFVADGQIPLAGSSADVGKAWCVKGDTHKNDGLLTFEWPQPVTIAEIVYFGRTAWFAQECWKDYQIFLDGQAKPVAKGTLQRGDGPQKITLAKPQSARKLVMKFTSSYGGYNPGAHEVQVYASATPDGALGTFAALPNGTPGRSARPPKPKAPPVKIVESEELKNDFFAGKLGVEKLVLIHRHDIRPTHVYTLHCEGFRPGGGLYVMTLAPDGKSKMKCLVDSPEGEILDLDVSYDGTEILFSWRRTAKDAYHVFRIKADGTDLTQLTEGPHHNYNVGWLPDGDVVFLSSRQPQFAYCWFSPVGIVHRMTRDGENVRRLSANYLNDFTPSILNDGRIIYGRWEYVDRPAIPIQSLWTLNPDGTGLSVFYGNRVLSPATFIEPRAIPGSRKVLCILTAHNGPCRGAIGVLDPVQGVNAQEAIRNLTPEINIGQVDKGSGNNVRGPYVNPYPLDGERFLVSRQGTVILREFDGPRQAVVIGPEDGMGFYSPQPLRARTRPPVIGSALPEGADEWATVVLQDVYQGLAPYVKRGEVKSICVVQEMRKSVRATVDHRAFGFQFPVISCGATYAAKTVWGYVPVDEDGSAAFRVPAGVPLYFMAVDAQGRAVQRMRSFTHLMPGEVQGCIGCHEPRTETSRPHRPVAAGRNVQELKPPEWGRTGFDFSRIVQPVLTRYCIQCHSGVDPPKGNDLTGDKTDFFCMSYETLARGRKGRGAYDNPYTSWIPTYNGHEANILKIAPKTWGSPASKLAEVLLSGHPDENGQVRFRMDAASRQRVLAWIDLNVPYYGTSETAYPNLRGCRQLVPKGLEATLAEVAKRRCASCHKGGKIPRNVYTRITNPQMNSFLLAPLARSAGGRGTCKSGKGGKGVFPSVSDPDYQKILATFAPLQEQMKKTPRMDMPGAKPSDSISRSCQ